MKEVKNIWNNEIKDKDIVDHILYKMIKHQYIKQTLGYEAWFDKVFTGISPIVNKKKLNNGFSRYNGFDGYWPSRMNRLVSYSKSLENNDLKTDYAKKFAELLALYRAKYPELEFNLEVDVQAFKSMFESKLKAGVI
jgi:hypothetical protein